MSPDGDARVHEEPHAYHWPQPHAHGRPAAVAQERSERDVGREDEDIQQVEELVAEA